MVSGLDDLTINRVEPGDGGAPAFHCDTFDDDLSTIDMERWEVLADDSVDVETEEGNLRVELGSDVLADGRGGLVSIAKYDLRDCFVTLEVSEPTRTPTSFTMLAALAEADDDVPLLSLRKEQGVLRATRLASDIRAIDFNQAQRFWRMRADGAQIVFEFSELGVGTFTEVVRVATPFEARAVHIAFVAGTAVAGVTESVVFDSFAMGDP